MHLINRKNYLKEIKASFRVNPSCALLGPRQVGKTTLSKVYVLITFTSRILYFST